VATSRSANNFDPEALRAKYQAERDKRLRPDGSAQYLAPTGRFAHYLDDPYVSDEAARAPVDVDTEVALVGAGFGGMQAAAHLVKAGVEDFLILDRAADFGGVWYWNRYPGIACDIDSYIYLPLLEDLGYMPSEKYAKGPEVFRYARDFATHFDLYRRSLLRTEIEELRWDDDTARWIISTDHGDRIRARFVNLATGPLQRPRLPGIPGIESFQGHSFHTSRWDYAYTGGDSTGGLEGLCDKRVGIIGTGATGVQAVPHLGRYAKQLYVFQRTPAPVPVRNHQPTDPEWARTLQPGWQRERMDNFNVLVCGGTQDVDLVADGWTDILHTIGIETDAMGDEAELRQLADFEFMENLRGRIDSVVQDKATAENLKPYYNAGCKRPCFHDDYLETFNRENVTLVATGGRGVDRVTETSVVVGEEHYEIDCLIYATGFDFNHTDLATRNGFEIYGRGGRSLTEKWRDGGISTLHGFSSRGFPNLVIQANAQGGVTPNITHGLGEGGKHFAYLVAYCEERDVRSFEPSEDAERAWVDRVHSIVYRSKYDLDCTPGYYNNDGKPTEGAGINAFYPGPHKFIPMMERWRDQDDLAGMDLTKFE
jgi:cyclohexanone monooxygenase